MSIGNRASVFSVCASLALAFGVAPAQASRSIDSQIPGFSTPVSIAFDANDYPWITDFGHPVPGQDNAGPNGLYKYDPYPSQTLLDAPDTFVADFGNPLPQVAVNETSDELFVAQSNGRSVAIFGTDGVYRRTWTSINGSRRDNTGGIHIAIDNTDTYSRGRIYLSLTDPENDVEILDADQRPVDFPAIAPYIKDNRLTGTPAGPFGEVQFISVDHLGNIYVTDVAEDLVDEFDSTGIFLRSFPAPYADFVNIPGTGGVGVDPTNGDVLVSASIGGVLEYDSSGNHVGTITADGSGSFQAEGNPGIDSQGRLYVPMSVGKIDIFKPDRVVPEDSYKALTSLTPTSGTLNATLSPNGGPSVSACRFEYGTTDSYGLGALPCAPDPNASPPGSNFSTPTDVSAPISGLTTETTYHYRVVAESANGIKYGTDQTYTPHKVVGLLTGPASEVAESEATLNGTLVGDGSATSYHFEWGPTTAYGQSSSSTGVGTPSGPGSTPLVAEIAGLEPYSAYHYRAVATGGAGTSFGEDRTFTTTPGIPSIVSESASQVHSDRALLRASINPNGADTDYRIEYVDDAHFQSTGFTGAALAGVEAGIGMSKHAQSVSQLVDGLEPGTVYHYRAVATNQMGVGTSGIERRFKTFPFGFDDKCPNVHVRQQTGAALLFDCRAYELVSAANAGGYDVESDLVPGQTPFGGYSQATGPSQVLYGVHDGGIPGTGNPTNHGVDPYLATRTDSGWRTNYVGIPADNPNATLPFASTLAEADQRLDTFAFGGADICSPCFADGSTGAPVRLPDGTLVQGMAGSMNPGSSAEPAGFVGRQLSADGSHFVFGSISQFEQDGNHNGDVTIYDRDLKAGVTHVVSKTPAAATMSGPGIGELDISSDGSRIVVGQLDHLDSEGNRYWHLYVNVNHSSETIDLTSGSGTGALYDGMTASGSKVFLTTADQLTGDDHDSSADIYEMDLSDPQSPSLSRVSTGSGGAGDTDSCDPAANTVRVHWNTVDSGKDCDAVAIGGGGGVSGSDGTIYLLSPELLDGASNGVQDAPNLYVVRPGAQPHFIRTLESSANAPVPPASHPFLRSFGSLENISGVAVDQSTGDVYALDIGLDLGTGYVYKFDSEGHPVTTFGTGGKLAVSGVIGLFELPTEIAVDNDPTSPNYRNLYVPDPSDGLVKIFDPSGGSAGQISVDTPTGVAVSASNGRVYTTTFSGGVSIFAANGAPITSFSASSNPTAVAVDSSERIYVVNGGGFSVAQGTTEIYDSSGNHLGQLDSEPAYGVSVDPADDHVYVNKGDRVFEFDDTGGKIGSPTGVGRLAGSVGVAAISGKVAVANEKEPNVNIFGPAVVPRDPNTDQPVVIDSVSSAGTRKTADFQVSPSGDFAVFTSTLPLSGFDNAGHREVFRYEAPTDAVQCTSCNPTEEQATGEATLASDGLSLTDDGRVFFNSTEGLVDRDLNGNQDAYQWKIKEGVELISTGTSPFAASLLGVSADGTDAYFFTLDTLVSADHNGTRVKVYDARAFGGFPEVPPPHACQASDECHGPGTQAPPAPNIKTIASTPVGNAPKVHRKRKHRRKHHKPHKKRPHQKRGHSKRGAAK